MKQSSFFSLSVLYQAFPGESNKYFVRKIKGGVWFFSQMHLGDCRGKLKQVSLLQDFSKA